MTAKHGGRHGDQAREPGTVAAKGLSSNVLANVYPLFLEDKHFFIAYQSTLWVPPENVSNKPCDSHERQGPYNIN